MKRRLALRVLVVLVTLVVLTVPLWVRTGPSGPSVLSRSAGGWFGLARLLASWEVETERVVVGADGELAAAGSSGSAAPGRALAVAFPADFALLAARGSVERALEGGARVLVGYSGSSFDLGEADFLDALGVELEESGGERSLWIWRWWREQRRGDRHRLSGSSRTFDTDRLARTPVASEGCTVLARRAPAGGGPADGPRDDEPADGAAVALRCARGEGELWVVPSSALVNARLAGEGNLELAHRLAAALGDQPIRFVEGELVSATPVSGEARNARSTLNLMALQVALLYLLAALALGRGFGPRWSAAALPPEGHRSFLLGVGALHERLGGFGEAAALLQRRWLDYDALARRRESATSGRAAADVKSGADLVAFAAGTSRRSSRGVGAQAGTAAAAAVGENAGGGGEVT